MLPVDAGGHAFQAFEHGDEIADIQIAHIAGDLVDALVGSPQLFLGKPDLLAVYIIHEGLPGLPVEQSGEIAGAQVAEIRHFFHGHVFSGVVPDKGDGGVNGAAGFHRVLRPRA